jgi:thiamine-monophosphate kinase
MNPSAARALLDSMNNRAGDRCLGDVGEKRLLAEFLVPLCTAICGDHGIGNDAGVLSVPNESDAVLSTDRVPSDLLARQFGLMTPADFGSYLVRVNVSDLAASGATPLGMVVTCAFNPTERLSYVLGLMWGMYVEAARLGCPVVGGDTKTSAEESVSAAVVGVVPKGRVVRRGPVAPGMRVYLSGAVGHAGAALRWFSRAPDQRREDLMTSEQRALVDALRERLIRPVPRIDLAVAVRESGCPCAMDITDGLGQSLAEIASANSVGIELNYDELRFSPATLWATDQLGLDLAAVIGGIGLDLELIAIGDSQPRGGFYEVGAVVEGVGAVTFADGRAFAIRGFEHFSRSASQFLT